jgi:general secretion pathway protein A
MYHQYFGLKEAPFSIAVNPRYLFMSPRHRDALAHLLYGVGAGGGFILLTGEVGTGKTTINRCLLEQLPDDTDVAIILNPALNAPELLATACDELGIDYDKQSQSLKSLTDSLHRYLLDNHARGRRTVLMIDEAQHLDFDVLEQIRLLTNLETNSEKLLQIILIGQPELVQLLNRPELRQLNQRITARYNLEPLNAQETAAYVRHRLQVAGLAPGRELFPAAVLKGLHRKSRGIPRVINVLCDRMLLGAYGRNKDRVDRSMLQLAAREVLGEENRGEASSHRNWLLPAVLASALAIGAGLWWFGSAPAAPAVGDVSAPAASPVVSTPPVTTPQAVEPPLATPVSPEPQPPTGSRWLLPPADGFARLWQLHTDNPQTTQTCSAAVTAGLACVSERTATWDELRTFDRPLLLAVVTPQRFQASVLVLAIEGRHAQVWTDLGMQSVELAQLGPLWQGEYQFLWHPPVGFDSPLSRGDRGAVVTEVAALFARLDQQSAPLANEQFNAALEQRVRLFQRQHALEDDGVVGVRTLLKLNELLGVDLTSAAALQQLQEGV